MKYNKLYLVIICLSILILIWMITTGGIKHGKETILDRSLHNSHYISDAGYVKYDSNVILIWNKMLVILMIIILAVISGIRIKDKFSENIVTLATLLILTILFIFVTPMEMNCSYRNSITVGGEQKDTRIYDEIKTYNLLEILNKKTIERN